MNKKIIFSLSAAALFALGFSGLQAPVPVQAAPVSQKSTEGKTAVSLMNYLAASGSLTKAQRKSAKDAAALLKNGKFGHYRRPSWFKSAVSLGSPKDATSSANIKAALPFLRAVNRTRSKVGARSLKVSPLLMATAMLNADYQKNDNRQHSHFFKKFGLENLAFGEGPIQLWMAERKAWQYDVRKSPSLKKAQYHPSWSATYDKAVIGTNGFKMTGHYLNLVNKRHRVMGWAHMTDYDPRFGSVDSFMAADKGAGMSVAKYASLVNAWLNK